MIGRMIAPAAQMMLLGRPNVSSGSNLALIEMSSPALWLNRVLSKSGLMTRFRVGRASSRWLRLFFLLRARLGSQITLKLRFPLTWRRTLVGFVRPIDWRELVAICKSEGWSFDRERAITTS